MSKLYGSLVGAVKQIVPMQPVDSAYERSKDMVIVRDTITLAAAAAATTIQACILGWESVLDPDSCLAHNAALGGGVTLSLGDITFPTGLDNAVAVNAASKLSLLSAVTIGNYYQPLWQLLGYASLAAAKVVGNQCELLFTIGGAAATGILTWRFVGMRRI